MKKFILSLLILMAASFIARSQDKIVKKDGTEIMAKIESVSDSKIEYKRQDYLDGPMFTIKARDVDYIIYANGQRQEIVSAIADLDAKGIEPGMKYKDYKKLYNARDYVNSEGGPYSPAGSGIASFFICGLGQMINGQAWKGVGMLLGSAALYTSGILCTTYGSKDIATAGFLTAWSCALALDIWSICDAVEVAKIKNMYYRDCRRLQEYSFDVKLMPDIAFARTYSGLQPTAGLKLAISF